MNLLALAATVLLHLCVAYGLLPHIDDKKPKKPAYAELFKGDDSRELIDNQPAGNAVLHIACPNTYDGIGIMLAWDGRIIQVAKGWPADHAGLVVGDRVIDAIAMNPVNGYMTFRLVRNGATLSFHIKTSQICYRDRPF